jgi:DNA excision repair protein ERCC-2
VTQTYTIAVRALCEFAAKRGDLDLRFTPSPTAEEGVAGHKLVASRRGAGYEAELSLEGGYKHLRVRGRADGWDASRMRLEEVKTFRGELSRMPANHCALHWAQVKVYGALLCDQRQLERITLALVYFDVARQSEHVIEESHDAASLRAFFESLCEAFLSWSVQEMAHRDARDDGLRALRFPHEDFRRGQRQLAEAAYNAARSSRCLMAQAPTGIGKTMGTVFPLLKAMPGQSLDRLFFLTAKGPGRKLAFDALARLRAHHKDLPLRSLELVARDKACEHPDKACHGESCSLAKGFYDRLATAREAALARPLLDQAALRDVALTHSVCPYYLGQEMARWCDVAVGDYNHYFDASALLHGLSSANGWRIALLVDEAHHIVERGRMMYSAELDQRALHALCGTVPEPLQRPLRRLRRAWNDLHKAQERDYQAHAEVPPAFARALGLANAAIAEHLGDHPEGVDSDLLRFHFDALHFARLIESFGDHSLFDVTLIHGTGKRSRRASAVCVRNLVPATFLKPRFEDAHCAVLFSATLSPARYYADLAGLPGNTVWIDVESPFTAEQLAVRIAGQVSTRWQHRDESLAPIAELIACQYTRSPGNYLAFFSSFEYLHKAFEAFVARHPEVPVWMQSRRMDAVAREAFLARFMPGGRGVGFAVLGGVFGEGIDLPGERLIGAFIATLGLPPLNPLNEILRERLAASFGAGYDYAYLYPGLQKVVQAAGRVIRTPADRGMVLLIDDRFARPEVRRLLPRWWSVEVEGRRAGR